MNIRKLSIVICIFLIIASFSNVAAQMMTDYMAAPPFISETAPPMVMLVMSKDHKSFYKAYTDISDLDKDGVIDTTYKDRIHYYGYFDSNQCYSYLGGMFKPAGPVNSPGNNHYCSGKWSGNFLNWATMARIDVLRKVLYGGHRSVDTNTTTVLSRTKLPADAHSWAKVYNGKDIGSLIPFPWSEVTLCNTNTNDTETSSLIYVKQGFYPYAASTEGKQCTKLYQGGENFVPDYTYKADVLVCDTVDGEDCVTYFQGTSAPTYKPGGLMQEFGVNRHGTDDTSDDTVNMYFGLISGSYGANVSGGVLRSNIADVPTQEVGNANGIILGSSKVISNIDNFRVSQYNYKTGWYDKGGNEGNCVPKEPSTLTDGTCTSWGNPIGEMLYESIRYFKGTQACTSQYKPANPDKGVGGLTTEAQWDDPYQTFPTCSKAFSLILSDSYPSYDSDDLPGPYPAWSSPISSSDTPSVTKLVNDSKMNSIESPGSVIVGESGSTNDRQCTVKNGDFSSIRGLCVEEPTKQGAYYTPSLAWHGRTTDLNPADGDQNMVTYSVATGSPLPTITLSSGNVKAYLIPSFHDGCPDVSYPGCATQGAGGDNSKGELVNIQMCQKDPDWNSEMLNGYQNCYDILWDDAEYGWDYDLDIAYRIYTKVNAGIVTVKTKGMYAAAGHTDYAGYYITGVDNSGEYLDIKCGGSAGFNDCDSYTGAELAEEERTFKIVGSSASILKGPLWYAAKYGGFNDKNNNNIPDLQHEWDINGNGVPDTYFDASNPLELEYQLRKALLAISAQASSGTSVSVLSTAGEGDGAVYQAYYYPEKLDLKTGRRVNWIGYMRSMFVDNYGNLREDTNNNNTLDMADDLILDMTYVPNEGTKVHKYTDSDADGTKDVAAPVSITDIDNIDSIWEGGEELWKRDPDTRTIYTSIDGFSGINFTSASASSLMPYLRAADNTESANIINWVRGDDLAGVVDPGHPGGYRSRAVKINNVTNVWKLGDIIHSTPTVVGRPMENYDLLYNDSSYTKFRTTHLNRRQVVYTGGNDGMLHAFNGGCFDEKTLTFYSDVSGSSCVNGAHTLGEELWAFIPRGMLPHLKWLTDPDYNHIYYVDLKPKITDVKIFNSDSDHPDGWGTILIGGYRMGGKDISWMTGGSKYSSSPEYFAMDITNPLKPKLLWTFSDPALGLSMSYPAVSKVGNSWYVTFGSGAKNYDMGSNFTTLQNGNVFVLQISGAPNGVINTWTKNTNYWLLPTGSTNSTLNDPISVDVDIDYNVDVLYIAENTKSGASSSALLKRITTSQGTITDPGSWSLSTVADVTAIAGTNDLANIISSAPTAAMDDRANLWVYFGTGQFMGDADKNQTDTGAFYAIKDGCWKGDCASSFNNLLDISSATVSTDGSVTGVAGACSGGISDWSSLLDTSKYCDGWAMYFNNLIEAVDFDGNVLNHTGERVISKPLVLGGIVSWATFIPGIDACSPEGESNAYAVYYKTGTANKGYVFEEQEKQASPSTTIARTAYLGKGMPSSPSAQVTSDGSTKIFFQQSTGAILTSKNDNPVKLKSGLAGWTNKQIQ